MDRLFHWVWYLLGIIFALSIHEKILHLPIIIIIIIWILIILSLFEKEE